MFERENLTASCRECVHDLTTRCGWGLNDKQIDSYVAQIIQQVPIQSLERQMALVVGYFHTEHERVADLRDRERVGYSAAWGWVEREIIRATQLKNLSWSHDPTIELSDLVQIVHTEIVRSLPSYHFESRLGTWIHGVTVRRLRRFHRDSSAKKRAVWPDSLELAAEQEVNAVEEEPALLASELVAEIKRVLARTGDKRYASIFLMHEIADLSSTEIGARLHLHPSRVRALLKIARELLRSDPRLRDWEAGEQPEEAGEQPEDNS